MFDMGYLRSFFSITPCRLLLFCTYILFMQD